VCNGYAGLITDNIKPLHARDVGASFSAAAWCWQRARWSSLRMPAALSAGQSEAHGIEALVVIGGNGCKPVPACFPAPVSGGGRGLDRR
jgi:6-phosphofructokinase